MRETSRGAVRSVDRGTCRLTMELRKRYNGSADAVRRSGKQHGRGRKREHPDGSPESETSGTHGNSWHGNQEIPVAPFVWRKAEGRKGNPQGHALHVRCREVGPLRNTG